MRRRNLAVVGLAVLLAALGSPTPEAADIGALADRAKGAAARNDYAGALDALQAALEAVRAEAPLIPQSFQLVVRPARMYGDYETRKNTVFRSGEAMHFYMEPKNLVYPRTARGTYEPAFRVDLEVIGPDGKTVAEKQDFGSFQIATKSPVQDIFLNLRVELTGAPAGEYKVRFTVRDTNSKKAASVVQPVTLR